MTGNPRFPPEEERNLDKHVDLDPAPAYTDKRDPIDRPLSWLDANNQETIWDSSHTPSGERYVPKSTAIEPNRVEVDVPPITEKGCLSHYVNYKCCSCREWCLNPRSEKATRHRECRNCVRLPDSSRELVDHLLPSLQWTASINFDSFPISPSAGTAERRTPPSGAAGSDPLRVDPAAGAQGPTEGTAPTTTEPQRRLSDSEARTDGGRRD